jgi:hypothetical protein
MECYVPYETHRQKRNIINKGNYLLKSSCCDVKTCDLLLSDIQDTKHKCNDLFRNYHEDNLDDKGNILTDTLCSQLKEKQNDTYNKLSIFRQKAGRRNKFKSIRKIKSRKMKSRKMKSRKMKK